MPPSLRTAVLWLPRPPSLGGSTTIMIPTRSRQFHASAPLRGLRNRLKNAGRPRTYDKRVTRSEAVPASAAEAAERVGKRIPNEKVLARDIMVRDSTRRETRPSPRVLQNLITENVLEQQLSNTPIIAGSSAPVEVQ